MELEGEIIGMWMKNWDCDGNSSGDVLASVDRVHLSCILSPFLRFVSFLYSGKYP